MHIAFPVPIPFQEYFLSFLSQNFCKSTCFPYKAVCHPDNWTGLALSIKMFNFLLLKKDLYERTTVQLAYAGAYRF